MQRAAQSTIVGLASTGKTKGIKVRVKISPVPCEMDNGCKNTPRVYKVGAKLQPMASAVNRPVIFLCSAQPSGNFCVERGGKRTHPVILVETSRVFCSIHMKIAPINRIPHPKFPGRMNSAR